jgi:hypothetical protein
MVLEKWVLTAHNQQLWLQRRRGILDHTAEAVNRGTAVFNAYRVDYYANLQ